MKAVTITVATWEKLKASMLAEGRSVMEPHRSPYGHVYLWLDPDARKALEAARGPSEGFDEVITRLIEETKP